MLCVIVKVYCHASAGMRCSIASRVQHAEVYCVVLKDSALIGGKQPQDMSEWVCHTKSQRLLLGGREHWTAAHTLRSCNRVIKLDQQNNNNTVHYYRQHSETQWSHLYKSNNNNSVWLRLVTMKCIIWLKVHRNITSPVCPAVTFEGSCIKLRVFFFYSVIAVCNTCLYTLMLICDKLTYSV